MTVALIFALRRSAVTCSRTTARYSSRAGARSATRWTISSYTLGYRAWNDRSSSSHLIVFMPRRWASGA
ncbi:Uncharacterised protein [Mycobacteroides abscessus]|nr:Uncharacterised protein [Mycobacteroides abscessus]